MVVKHTVNYPKNLCIEENIVPLLVEISQSLQTLGAQLQTLGARLNPLDVPPPRHDNVINKNNIKCPVFE